MGALVGVNTMAHRKRRPETRRNEILEAAVTLSSENHYTTVTRLQIAIQAECAEGTVNRYFNTMEALRVAVLDYALEHELHEIIAQGIAQGDINGRLIYEL